MDRIRKRNVFPMTNWDNFLEEGKNEFEALYDLSSNMELGKDEFVFKQILGRGAYGQVYLAYMNKDSKYYAIKVQEKKSIVKLRQVKHVKNEKRILQSLNHPFTVYLEYFFQDNSYLYFALPFAAGGEMFSHLRRMKKFEEPLLRFYSAQVLLAFEYLHYCDMLYRDLKPENLLVDERGYVKVTDFGFCKIVKGRTYTMCGTPEYIAPEIILSKGYGKPVDWWAFGVLLYELGTGVPPFTAREPIKIYEKTVACKYVVPPYISQDLEDLIMNLLQLDLSKRYGNLKNGLADIKEHKWFNKMDWVSLFNGKIEPPFVPNVKSPGDASNFDLYKSSPLKHSLSNKYSTMFDGF